MAQAIRCAFWMTTLLSIPAAYLLEAGIARWLALGWLGVIGALVSLSNWAVLVRNARNGRSSSFVPILGGPLLALALAAFSVGRTTRLVTLGALLDPWLALMILWPMVAAGRRLTRR
jgi:hypothetical protein